MSNEILQHFFKAYKEFRNLDSFVSKCREAAETGDIVNPEQGRLIKENWKRSDLFIDNLTKFCSFASFIDKYNAIEIDSQKWEEYISQLDLTIQYLQSLRNDDYKDQIKLISEQIMETERAFKIKMESLCTNTITTIETSIVIENHSDGS